MRILHSSDWHLGHRLYQHDRHDAFQRFLAWLLETIELEAVDVLLISGDVFDTSAPSSGSKTLFYNFLGALKGSKTCRHVVVTGGNHDSPAVLNECAELLKRFDLHVQGGAADDPSSEALTIETENGAVIVGAVPFLREQELRRFSSGETGLERERQIRTGLAAHYAAVLERAQSEQSRLEQQTGRAVPIVMMGHLYADRSDCADYAEMTAESPSDLPEEVTERELYVGNLGVVDTNSFALGSDYCALGHIHRPMRLVHNDAIRYSGSPLAMSFDEAQQGPKSVVLIEFSEQTPPNRKPEVRLIHVPAFEKLLTIRGDLSKLKSEIKKLVKSGETCFVRAIYKDDRVQGRLRDELTELTEGSGVEILLVEDLSRRLLFSHQTALPLSEQNPREVFKLLMAAREVAEDQRDELMETYLEVLRSLEDDPDFENNSSF